MSCLASFGKVRPAGEPRWHEVGHVGATWVDCEHGGRSRGTASSGLALAPAR